MEKRKLTKEDLDKVRDIDGFPIGSDEDIIALSDPPYYTACPNPFIEDFIKENGTPYDEATDNYHCEPYAADVSESKMDPIYNAHSYHTKVPYKAIMKYILHYTKPGDIVLDAFCGSGMTGIAAQMCGNKDINCSNNDKNFGLRYSIIGDLSPAATFISHNYNTPIDIELFKKEANRVINDSYEECKWMYETIPLEDTNLFTGIHNENKIGKINYTIWSDVFICPNCGEEIVFWDAAVNYNEGKVSAIFRCSRCNAEIKKINCKHCFYTYFDEISNKNLTLAKQIPVSINYTFNKVRINKKIDIKDLDILKKIEYTKITNWFPKDYLPNGYNTAQPIKSHGLTNVYLFYTKRNLCILSNLLKKILDVNNKRIRDTLLFGFNNVQQRHCKLNAMRFNVSFPSNITSGTLFIPSIIRENNIYDQLKNKYFKRFIPLYERINNKCNITFTNSATRLLISQNSIDYIFTDPPFGNNLMYSELNFIWESWLKVKTNNKTEAIINDTQKKGLYEYQELMYKCFCEYYRVLKPNRWMTVEFHNSKNAVWNAIQEAILKAGFVIADVRTLDKQQGSFKQVTTTSAVKQDLVISAYKPKESFKHKMLEEAGKEETAWAFIRQHLENLPIVVLKNDKLETVAERQAYLLFDRMVAYHIMHSLPVPLDASEFYNGLKTRNEFLERDGMYFLPSQVNEYDTARITKELEKVDFSLFVTNEKSAIGWLYRQLNEKDSGKPQTYAELQPKFMQELKTADKYEAIPELAVLLQDNFLKDDESGKWRIPDPTKEADVKKLREKNLLKEFETYAKSSGKLKTFRSEAIRLGFAHLWKEKNYKSIVDMGARLPETVIQEDTTLLMYYDNSLIKLEKES